MFKIIKLIAVAIFLLISAVDAKEADKAEGSEKRTKQVFGIKRRVRSVTNTGL